MRYFAFLLVLALAVIFALLGQFSRPVFFWPLVLIVPLSLLGIWDVLQKSHSVLRNYPIIGHLRWLLESVRPELRQYFFASDTGEEPFNREERSLVYQRAKNEESNMPFGTQLELYEEGYSWINHSINPSTVNEGACRIKIGGKECKKPYSSSVLNVSAMSFGSLSSHAIQALNKGAKKGGFAHDTGEGGISRHHRHGGDLIWEIGSGYFGCRNRDGSFSPEKFTEKAADDQVKMIELKLSQGAKPGHGGILPGAKVTEEIAEARGVEIGEDCISPNAHSSFSTPIEMMEFLARLRDLSGGKPTGFKLCVGHRWEFMAVAKAMRETGIVPDFIVVDGAEGGTGAAPREFSNHIGTPLSEGLAFVNNVLVGTDLRDQIKIGASGKVISAFHMVRLMSLGADWCNAARAFMFALGCIQSQSCHTNRCPVGIATQDKKRVRALVVEDKAERVYRFHHNTVHAFEDVLGAAGLTRPSDIRHHHFFIRDGDRLIRSGEDWTEWLETGELLNGTKHEDFSRNWDMSQAGSFSPRAL